MATVALNYFGTVATFNGLRPLLEASAAPRAVLVSSLGALAPSDLRLVQLLESGDEDEALAYAATLDIDPTTIVPTVLYTSSKLAITRWARREAPTPSWAGAGIALNVVAPGIVATPMNAAVLADPEASAAMMANAPAPFRGPAAAPSDLAGLLAFLASADNGFTTGQVIFADGGAESLMRPDLY